MVLADPAIVSAEGEHSRRAGAELLVILGDIQKLKRGNLPEKQKKGLRDRISGTLSGLPLLLRLADEERNRIRSQPDMDRYRRLLAEQSLNDLTTNLKNLSRSYPFRATGILPATASNQLIGNALQQHKTLCAPCHDSPYLDTERPAYNLFDQAQELEIREFAARMVVGVRGDATTGLDNPFSDAEIRSLIVLYRTTGNSAQSESR
ncbi:MAG: hypothetical protein GY703_14140 [Gammaproteobacteria bacterium]|nr:hypothetical protein [Gammaproteobacteria bacterium]